jgi:hypothetical protein
LYSITRTGTASDALEAVVNFAGLFPSTFEVFDSGRRGTWRPAHHLLVEDGPKKGAVIRLAEPGAAMAPDVYIAIKDGRTVVQDERGVRDRDDSPGAPIISTTASSLDKPLEILGSVVDALPGIARAAVLLHPHTLADDSIGTLHEVSQIRRAGVRNSFEHVHLIRTAGRAIRAIPKDTGDRS